MSRALNDALERLLVDRAYRAAFLDGRYDALSLAPDDVAALLTIDRVQLVRTAERVCDDLMARQYRGSGGLRALYPETVGAWRRAWPDDAELRELGARFLESPAYRTYRELPFAGPGQCLEEAFFRFAEAIDLGDPVTRERERVVAVVKALALSPDPAFIVPGGVRRLARGWVSVAERGDPPVMCAAVDGRLVQGPITPFLRDLILSADPPAAVAARHGVARAVLEASVERLASLGVVEPRDA